MFPSVRMNQIFLFISSYIECYNEKVIYLDDSNHQQIVFFFFFFFQMIILNDLEERLIQLYKQRSDMIVTRRQEDVKDQCMEYSTSKF